MTGVARHCWAVLRGSDNSLDGTRQWLDGTPAHPCRTRLFETRAEARAYIASDLAYIARRPDLRREPHGWRVPRPVRVQVAVAPVTEPSHNAGRNTK